MPNINLPIPVGAYTTSLLSQAFSEIQQQFFPLISANEPAPRLILSANEGLGAPWTLRITSFGGLQIVNSAGALAPVILASLPTSGSGLPSGSLWRDDANGNVVKQVP
jgi:hypothetical protein